MNVRIDVNGGGYQEACDAFYDANHGVVDAVSKLSSAVGGLGGCRHRHRWRGLGRPVRPGRRSGRAGRLRPW